MNEKLEVARKINGSDYTKHACPLISLIIIYIICKKSLHLNRVIISIGPARNSSSINSSRKDPTEYL